MPAVYEHSHTVLAEEIDSVGHVNNLMYLKWLQDAALAHSAAQGWPDTAYREAGHGWVVRSHHIEYLVPAFLNDEIFVRTWIADMKRVTSLRRYEIIRRTDNKQLARASTQWAFVRFATHQACRVPAEISSAFEILLDPEES
jgi:acyl-CoA thioester hydrolase